MPDPAIKEFLARLPPTLAASFTTEQLAAVKLHFAMRYATRHRINWRLRLPRLPYYLVLLAGCDGRGTESK